MYTQCPECHAVFVVTSEQLRAADGVVRCGQCENVFNGREYVTFRKSGADRAPGSGVRESEAPTENPLVEEQTELAGGETIRDRGYPAAKEPSPGETTLPASAELALENGETPAMSTFAELFVPEIEYPDDHGATRLLWGAGSIGLVLLLATQVTWFHRDTLSTHPTTGAVIRSLCSHVDCALAVQADPDKIILESRNVYTHPDQPQALMISAVLRNDAAFAQPPPILKVSFSDLQGTVLAARVFHPDEYLAEAGIAGRLLAPGESAPVRLELLDPGGPALNFEIEFL
ncbi:MAG: DUF3426 domain-containing protein [Pseudomonadota bacterium]|nr:DUF3426 domain-containing protein [Pseudomonadota bacterium]